MPFKLDIAKFFEQQSKNVFFEQLSQHIPESSEDFFINLEIENAGEYGSELFEIIKRTFQENYFLENEDEPEERFENSLKTINQKITEFVTVKGITSVKINSIVAINSEEGLLLTQSGVAEAYLLRQGKLNIVSEGLSASGVEIFASVASGELIDNDKLILSTSRLLRFLSAPQLSLTLKGPITDGLDAIKDFAKANEELNLAVIGVAVKKIKTVQDISEERDLSKRMLTDNLRIKKVYDYLVMLWEKKKDRISQQGVLLGIIVLSLLVFISIFFLTINGEGQRQQEEYRQIMNQVEKDLEKITNISGDPVAANVLVLRTEERLKQVFEAGYYKEEAMTLNDMLKEKKELVNQIYHRSDLTSLADLSDKRSNIEALGLIHFRDSLYVFDFNALYKTILNHVESPLTINENEMVIAGTEMEDRGLMAFYTKNGKILEYQDETFNIADTDDETWHQGVDIAVFRKNLYLLDPASNQIWKYTRNNSSYSTAKEYIKEENIDISDAISFAIDGAVYVLKKGGEILYFYSNKLLPFSVEGVPEGSLALVNKIFTKIDYSYIYLLDSKNARVVVLQKDVNDNQVLKYKKQYLYEGIGEINDLYVDQAEEKIYLLSKAKIYEIDLD